MEGRAAGWGKAAAPRLAPVGRLGLTSKAETYLAILQGKGSGTGWDLGGETAAAVRFLPPGRPLVLDVGANRGQWSRSLLSRVAPQQIDLVLFEPVPACIDALSALGLPDARVVEVALSDRTGDATIFADEVGSGAASLYERRDTYFGDMTAVQTPVHTARLDDLAAGLELTAVDYLKIDVEGAELAVLRGAQGLLAERRISTVAFEFGSANIYSRTFFRDFWDLLVGEHGFQIWRIQPGGALLPIPAYGEDLEHFRGVSNYVASLGAPRRPAAGKASRR